MSDPALDAVRLWLKEHEQNLLDDYRAMLQIPSLEADAEPGAPFGPENRKALDLALGLADGWGMRTTDMDGYIGYAEFGEGDKEVAVFGHLDVVPIGPGWKHDPFGAEIDGGYVYARGAVDDKGPTMAAFYALRAIQATGAEVPCRMRIAFGLNEESGFRCIKHYAEREKPPTFGFAPDAGWPLYHAEKGIMVFDVETPLIQGEVELLEVTGGQRPNIVIDRCQAKVRVADSARAHVVEALADAWDANVSTSWDGDVLLIDARGKAAHGARPFSGDSAAIRAFRLLSEITPLSVKGLYEELLYVTQANGAGLGIAGSDEISNDLTNNLGIVTTVDGKLRLTFNPRYPVTWKGADLWAKMEKTLKAKRGQYSVTLRSDSPALYFPLDHPLVKTVVDVYAEETGEGLEPGVMGGGTYARAIANTVAIGTGWEGDGDAHENDERLKVEHLFKMSRIYAHILLRLARATTGS